MISAIIISFWLCVFLAIILVISDEFKGVGKLVSSIFTKKRLNKVKNFLNSLAMRDSKAFKDIIGKLTWSTSREFDGFYDQKSKVVIFSRKADDRHWVEEAIEDLPEFTLYVGGEEKKVKVSRDISFYDPQLVVTEGGLYKRLNKDEVKELRDKDEVLAKFFDENGDKKYFQ